MKTIRLQKISYHNFKGIKDFSVEADSQNVAISGQNAAGKTTLFDGFWWLLFGKNSSEASKFNPKPLDGQGNEVLGLEPEVEAVLEIDDQEVTLRRKLAEVWTKPRGQAEKERKSDKTELYVDDVPYKLKDYTAYVDAIMDEETFKLLTNPAAFNNLKWQDRRKILLTIAGDVDEKSVIEGTDYGQLLTDILSDHTAEEQRKIIASQRRKLKGDIDSIPQRIDEANRAMPDLSSSTEEQLQAMLEDYQKSQESLQAELASVDASDVSSDARKRKAELQTELTDKQAAYLRGMQLATNGLAGDVSEARIKVSDLQNQLDAQTRKVNTENQRFSSQTELRAKLLDQYHAEADEAFDESSLVCPTCGQEFPAAKQDELKAHFNAQKSETLESLVTQGKAVANELTDISHSMPASLELLNDLKEQLEAATANLKSLQEEYDHQSKKNVPFTETAIYQELTSKIAACDEEIQSGAGSNDTAKVELRVKIDKIQSGIRQVQSELSKYQAYQQQTKRIEELSAEEAELKQSYNALDKQSFALDQYIHAKATAQEDKINAMFGLVTFKLFETQKNGEINDICEAMVDGVPYSTDLNNAARINAGLDIINTLSKYYGVSAPIFVDNAESVNEIMPVEAQEIRLIVSTDKELTTKVGEA